MVDFLHFKNIPADCSQLVPVQLTFSQHLRQAGKVPSSVAQVPPVAVLRCAGGRFSVPWQTWRPELILRQCRFLLTSSAKVLYVELVGRFCSPP